MNTQINFETYDGNKPYIFVSYSHYDIDKVYPILNRLHDENFRIWFDDVMRVGHDFVEELKDRIAECSVFLVFVSKSSMKSKYCGMEIITAYKNNKDIYPIFVEDDVEIPDSIKMIFENIQYVKITDLEKDKKSFMSVINSLPIETNTQLKPCINCGKGIKIGDAFCPRCGAMQSVNQRHEDKSNYEKEISKPKIKAKEKVAKTTEKELSMKWYNYLVKFQLIASVVVYICLCFAMFEDIYDYYYTENIIYGIGYLPIIIMAIITRNKLKDFCKSGPLLYMIYLIMIIVVNLIYFVLTYGDETAFAMAFTATIILVCGNMYFKKRKHLFIK